MASSQNSIPNSSQVNLDIFGSDIDKHNLKSTVPSVQHHLQVILSCECCLHRETLGVLQALRGRLEDLASGRNRTQAEVVACNVFAMASGSSSGIA